VTNSIVVISGFDEDERPAEFYNAAAMPVQFTD
jgi:hypothetical protein